VSDGESVKKAFGEIEKEFSGRNLAAAVYNVGGTFVKKPFLEMAESEFRAGFEANGCGFLLSSLSLLVHALHWTHPELAPSTSPTSHSRSSSDLRTSRTPLP
jgi:hypothetical protein